MSLPTPATLLSPADPCPVERVCVKAGYSGALICEHAGRAIPQNLNNLGLGAGTLDEHVAYDIGAEATARVLADKLSVPLVLQRYSRLVIDCNRPTTAKDSMPEFIHGTAVAGNENLNQQARQLRIDEIFTPFDNAVTDTISATECRWAFSIHSFTPELNNRKRPWDIGLLFREDTNTSRQLAKSIQSSHPELTVGLNEPYAIDDESDWFVPQHAERLKLQHSLIEIRNDHITTTEGQNFWATLLANAIADVVDDR